jgi:hypothetical protein
MKQRCQTCKFAPVWTYSSNGRINGRAGGRCRWTLPPGIKLPHPAGWSRVKTMEDVEEGFRNFVVPSDGATCLAWEAQP